MFDVFIPFPNGEITPLEQKHIWTQENDLSQGLSSTCAWLEWDSWIYDGISAHFWNDDDEFINVFMLGSLLDG